MSLSEWIMFASTVAFWQAIPLRTVFIYWIAVGLLLGIKWFFKF